jgi:hypothetical protein
MKHMITPLLLGKLRCFNDDGSECRGLRCRCIPGGLRRCASRSCLLS